MSDTCLYRRDGGIGGIHLIRTKTKINTSYTYSIKDIVSINVDSVLYEILVMTKRPVEK